MNWTPRWKHVTQWGSSGDPSNGGNNCAETSISRALLEYDPATPARMASPEWGLVRAVHDPNNPATVLQLMDRISVLARGYHIGPWDGFTGAEGIQAALNAFGLDWSVIYTGGANGAAGVVAAVQASPLALLWVNGEMLAPSSYNGPFFAGDFGWDHIILSLPDGNLMNDPLSDLPDRKTDVRYDWGAVQAAIGGAWLLPAPETVGPRAMTVLHAAALKAWPNHLGLPANKAIAQLVAGETVIVAGGQTPHWLKVANAAGMAGWLLTANLKAA